MGIYIYTKPWTGGDLPMDHGWWSKQMAGHSHEQTKKKKKTSGICYNAGAYVQKSPKIKPFQLNYLSWG